MRYTRALALAAAAALLPAAAHAQTTIVKTPAPHQQVLTTNPLGVIAKWFNLEYERKIGPSTTMGVAASTFEVMDYTGASLLLRWYSQGAVLRCCQTPGSSTSASRSERLTERTEGTGQHRETK